MTLVDGRAAWRLLVALVAMATMALALASCGESDDPDGGSSNDATAAAGGDDGDQVSAAMRTLREQYNDTDGQAFCDGLTEKGRREVVALRGTVQVKATDCAGIITEYSKSVVAAGSPQTPIKVRRVTVEGDRARLVVTGGLAGVRRIVPFRFVRMGSDWKLVDPVSASQRTIGIDESIKLK